MRRDDNDSDVTEERKNKLLRASTHTKGTPTGAWRRTDDNQQPQYVIHEARPQEPVGKTMDAEEAVM
jgi:hypothetical protein